MLGNPRLENFTRMHTLERAKNSNQGSIAHGTSKKDLQTRDRICMPHGNKIIIGLKSGHVSGDRAVQHEHFLDG